MMLINLKNITAIFVLTALIFFLQCTKSVDTLDGLDNPDWINELIKEFESEPVGNPPQSIWRYNYKEQIVYYVPPQCCDQFSVLYNADGDAICAPDGGFTGRGDGHCPDFFSTRTDQKLIWQDKRIRE